MGTDISAFVRHEYNGFPTYGERLSFLRRTARQVAAFYDLDEDAISEEVEVEDDSFAFYIGEIGVRFNLMQDCWEINTYNGFYSYFIFCNHKLWLREFVFDVVRSLGGREAWITTDYGSLYCSDNPNNKLDNHLAELMEEYSLSVIPEITYSVIEEISDWGDYEEIYHDYFEECWRELHVLKERYSRFGDNVNIKALQPQISTFFRLVEIDGKKYLFNDNNTTKFVDFAIDSVKILSSRAFVISADEMSYLYAFDGHLLHKKRNGIYLSRELNKGELYIETSAEHYQKGLFIYEKTSNWTLLSYWTFREKDGYEEQYYWYHKSQKVLFTKARWWALYYDCKFSPKDNKYSRISF